MKMRNMDIDAIKGVAIILVVIGHVIQYICAITDYESNLIYNIIYSFHMPLFMFWSGYLAYRQGRELDAAWIKKRFLALIVPYVVWIVVTYFWEGHAGSGTLVEWCMDGVLYVTNGAPWFLWVLFLNGLILYLGTKLRKYTIKNDIVFALLIVGVYVISYIAKYLVGRYPFGLNLCAWYVAFFIAGYLTNLHALFEKLNTKVYFGILIILCMVFWTWRVGGKPFFYESVVTDIATSGILKILFKGVCLGYKYLVPFLWICVIYWFFQHMPQNSIKNWLAQIGTYTMEIYIMHTFILKLVKVPNIWLATVFALILGIAVPIIISNILNRCEVVKKILFGR